MSATPEEVRSIEADWTTWSDAELMGRLLRRHVEPVAAKGLVRDRMQEEAIEEIKVVLEQEYLDDNDNPVRLESSLERRARR